MPVMFSAQPCCDIDCKDVRVPLIESRVFPGMCCEQEGYGPWAWV